MQLVGVKRLKRPGLGEMICIRLPVNVHQTIDDGIIFFHEHALKKTIYPMSFNFQYKKEVQKKKRDHKIKAVL